MEIRSKLNNKFLCNVKIEEYYNYLKKMGIDVKIPLVISFATGKGMIEEYDIYPEFYELRNAKKKTFTK